MDQEQTLPEELAAELGIEQPGGQSTPQVDSGAEEFDWSRTVEIPDLGEVPLAELRDGYLRQSDYTRKTQELARERERIPHLETAAQFLQALETNPQGTIKAVAEAYGLSLAEAREMVNDTANSLGEPQSVQLPPEVQQKLSRIDAIERDLQNRQIKESIQAEIDGLKARYGDEFDEVEVVNFAVQRNNPDLELAFLAWKGQKSYEDGLEQGRKEAAARAKGTVESTGGPRSTTGPVDSVEAAWAEAKRQHVGR